MVAQKKSFAEKQGLNLEIVQFKRDALALKAMIAGELDSYEGSPGGPMLAVIRGADVKLVGCYWPGLTYAIFTRAEVNSVADLKGKTFGISSPGALPDLFARSVLEANHISADDVQFAAMGTDTDRFRTVSAGLIGAAAASTEFTPMVKDMGQVRFSNVCKTFPIRVNNKTHMVHALKSINFEVAQSEIVVLIGPSGCGKTTALRILMGLETAGSGSVSVDGAGSAWLWL